MRRGEFEIEGKKDGGREGGGETEERGVREGKREREGKGGRK